jgi:signal transduction histidine kinase/CHASE1-domain containing sensor protein
MRPRLLWRWRERVLAAVLAIVAVAGFVVVRHLSSVAARRQAEQRAELVALQVESSAGRAAAYVDAIRGYIVAHREVSESEFSSFALGILGFAELDQAAWIEAVVERHRAAYEASIGRRITQPEGRGLVDAPTRPLYYPATLITEVLAGDAPGVDLGSYPQLRQVLESSEPLFSVVATAPVNLLGANGLFLVEAAPRSEPTGDMPGFVVVYVPVDWLEGSLAGSGGIDIRVGGGSIGVRLADHSAITRSFVTAGRRWTVAVPRGTRSAAATALSWSLLVGAVGVAALVLLLGAKRGQAEEERRVQLLLLQSLDRISRAVQSTSDVEEMLASVLDEVLAIFSCDCAWVIHPCDPEAASHRVLSVRARTECPGACGLGAEIPNDPDTADAMRLVLSRRGPVRFDPESGHALPLGLAGGYEIRSLIVMAVYPKMNTPYMFGLHQCTHLRIWTPPEERLFQEIGWRLADALETGLMFSQLVESRGALRTLADEQAALRRVATLVAEGAAATAVFDSVTAEMGRLLGADGLILGRYEPDDELTIVAHRGSHAGTLVPGTRASHRGHNVTTMVRRSERPARLDPYEGTEGVLAELVQGMGVRASVGVPIVVDGELWGLAVATWSQQSAPGDAERRLAECAQLLETAIANADSRDRLNASRARLLTAADEARRRVVRDLHDGAQQRLVQTILTLKLVLKASKPSDRAKPLIAEALQLAEQANSELRELAHGILPAVLTQGGLRVALASVVKRVNLPVEVKVPNERYAPEIEASAYFIVAEALTNVVKHAYASSAEVCASVIDGSLRVEIRDDGIGGANPAGHGLVGTRDRAAALGGRVDIESPPGGGTIVTVILPLSMN